MLIYRLVLLYVTLVLACLSAASVNAQSSILVIESYHQSYPWDASYLEGIREVLGDQHQITIFEMDTKRLPPSAHQGQAEKAWSYFQTLAPDFVILGDDNALKYLGKRISATGTPTIYLGINNNPRELGLLGVKNLTGILERPLFTRNIMELNRVMDGQLKSALILFDSGKTARAAVEEAFYGQDKLTIGTTSVTVKSLATIDAWKDAVEHSAEHYDAIIVGLYHTLVDDSGEHVPADQALAWTSTHTKVPLFAFWDFAVGPNKTAGGLVLFGKAQGQEAADMILENDGGHAHFSAMAQTF